MIDYFSYNGKGVLPKYSPGIPGYGQKGAPGNTGEIGASIYYSSFKLSNETECVAAKNKLNSGKSLSNNILYNDNEVIDYKEGDIILDTEGNFYTVVKANSELTFSTSPNLQTSINTSSSLSIRDFVVSCITSFKVKKTGVDPDIMSEPTPNPDTGEIDYPDYDDDTYSWKIENPYYINLSNSKDAEAVYSKSPYIAHKNYYSKYLYGNHVKFTIVNEEPLENCIFKYSLVFPSGETLSLTTDSMSGVLFVDNNFVYDNIGEDGPFSSYTYKIDEDSEQPTLKSIKDLIAELGEGDKYVALAASEYIKKYCKAYVEITNTINNTTYRIDVDDLFFRGGELVHISDDEYPNDASTRVDYIIPGKLSTEWKTVKYICGNEYHPKPVDDFSYVKYINGDCVAQTEITDKYPPTFLRSFNQFNKFTFRRENCNYSKDTYEIKCTYNFGGYSDDEHYSYHPKTDSEDNLPLTNNTIRLYFNKIQAFTIIIKFNPVNKNEVNESGSAVTPIYPNSNLYIGIPNVPLLNWIDGSNKASAELVNGEWRPALPPGIVYLNKIVPIANPNETSIYTKEIDAGIAQVIINTDNYPTIVDKNKDNFIEIGVISTEDGDGAHCDTYDISLYIFSIDDTPQDITISDGESGDDEPITIEVGECIPAPRFE